AAAPPRPDPSRRRPDAPRSRRSRARVPRRRGLPGRLLRRTVSPWSGMIPSRYRRDQPRWPENRALASAGDLQLPGGRHPRVGGVGAERARANRGVEMLAQRWVHLLETLDRRAQRARDAHPGALGHRAGAARATAHAEGTRQLLTQELDLCFGASAAPRIVRRVRLVAFGLEVEQAAAVGRARLGVEHNAGGA